MTNKGPRMRSRQEKSGAFFTLVNGEATPAAELHEDARALAAPLVEGSRETVAIPKAADLSCSASPCVLGTGGNTLLQFAGCPTFLVLFLLFSLWGEAEKL